MLKKSFVAALAALTCPLMVQAGEAEIRKAAAEMLQPGTRIDEIRKTEIKGLNEVRVGQNIFYADDTGRYFIMGEITDTKTKRNLTEERMSKLTAIKFSELPLNQAVKIVRGNGKRVFATFEDPNCGYCKKLSRDLLEMNDYTQYIFLYPILNPDSHEKSKNIWCAKDPAKAWISQMTRNETPAAADCETPIDKNLALGQRLNVRGTPNIFLTNGQRIPGFIAADQLSALLDQADSGK